MTLEKMTQIAVHAAYQAGEVLNNHFGKLTNVAKKGSIDLVTAADIASENEIITVLKKTFPDHSILAEESGSIKGDARHQWIIDPLDGTTNFVHNLPIFAVSIAHANDGQVDVAVVFNPSNGELFSAWLGGGATLNNRPISVSKTDSLENCLLVTGFPYTVRDQSQVLMHRFKQCLLASQGIRRLGSAALDLCFVACGRFDGFWEENLKTWDTAAGMLIAREAGGIVTDFGLRAYEPHFPEILATNGRIHTELQFLLNQKEPS